jgi:hypothetical protein
MCFLLTSMSAQRERPTENPAHRTKPERIEQGVGGGRAERRVAVTVTGRKQFFLFVECKRNLFFFKMLLHQSLLRICSQ